MGSVNVEEAKKAISDVLAEGQRKGELTLLTVRIVLQKVEKELELEENALMDSEHKKALRAFIKEESTRVGKASNIKQEQDSASKVMTTAKPSSSAKRKSEVAPSSPIAKKRSKAAGEELEERQERPKSKPNSIKKQEGSPDAGASNGTKRRGSFKSKDTIDSDSELEGAALRKTTEETMPASTSKKKKRRSADSAKEKESEVPTLKPLLKKSKEDPGESKEQSDSELSVLTDGPPTKRAKARPSKIPSGDSKKARTKKSETTLSPDEEQIKKLKSFVVACGVRKVWSKELKDCETTSSQISHLRNLLSNLGMKGRYSLEQAKAVKAKRELAQELEDVKVFAEKHTRDRSTRASAASGSKRDDAESTTSNDEDEVEAQPRKRKNAHASILAFLGDQSDSD